MNEHVNKWSPLILEECKCDLWKDYTCYKTISTVVELIINKMIIIIPTKTVDAEF